VRPSYTSRRTLLNRFVGGLTYGFIGAGLGSALPYRGARADWSLPEPIQPATAFDGDTLQLASGDQVRLVGIEAPKPALAPDDPAMAALAATATASLHALAARGVILRYDVLRRDRYGRQLAQAFDPDGTWLQARQIAAGLARVHGDGSNRGGLAELLIGEDEARAAGRGLWRHRAFALRRADDRFLKRLAGSFQIVSGRAVSAAIAGSNGYVNFGADRRTDFTLVIHKPVLAMLDPAVVDLTRLEARSIRCRGWIDLHDGPSMDLACPEHIELLED
jgi:endonuclease YncB( thermonuclease family)